MQFHKSPHMERGLQDISQILASSHRAQWGADNTNPIEKFRLFSEKRNAADTVVVGAHSEHSAWRESALKSWRIMWHSPIWESRFIPIWYRPPIVGKTRPAHFGWIFMREISSLVHILPLNALANAKSLSIFERNYKFPFYLMSCKRPGLENFGRKWIRA